jgi:hypothetical protein
MSVNALLRGWTQYYCYASNATQRFGHLTGVAFWLTAHYLGRKHRRSIKRVMAHHYGVDPRTGKRALYVPLPGDIATSSDSTCERGMASNANTAAKRVQNSWSTIPIGSRHGRRASMARRG